MDRADFIAGHPIDREFEARGVVLIGEGRQRKAKCPFHEDKNPSVSIDMDKQLWNCHAGCGGGSVIDLIARFENTTAGNVLSANGERNGHPAKSVTSPRPALEPTTVRPVIETVYPYHNAFGKEVYQALRMKPKSFRQRRPDGSGGWIWNMEGVERVLYRLPEVLQSQTVAICEGEKDAATLVAMGYCATCNVGGAGKWMDAYTESLAGKDVLLFGDNDKPGEDHVALVFESLAGKAKTVKNVKIPKTFKDVTDYAASFESRGAAKKTIEALVSDAHSFVHGIHLPIFSMAEMEERYIRHVKSAEADSLNLGHWLPTLGQKVRRLVPGEVVLVMGDTGAGKTAMLSSIALAAKPLPTLMFEMELPGELLFERFVAAEIKLACREVERTYSDGETIGMKALNHHFPHLHLCWDSRQTVENLERLILRSELKIGVRPKLVLLDYVQLIGGGGKSRYERVSNVAEELKVVAKTTRTIIVVASQVGRPSGDDPEITLHDAKESGSLENSAGLVLGAWRDGEDKTLLHIKILKNTKGRSGDTIPCNFDGETMRITERTKF